MCGNHRGDLHSFLKPEQKCGPHVTDHFWLIAKHFPFHPKPTVCRLGRVTQRVRSEGYEWERERASVTCTRDSALSYGSFGRGLYYLQLGHNVLLSRWTEADRPHCSVSSSRVRRRPCVREDVFLCRWAVQYRAVLYSKLLDFRQRHMRVKMTVPQRWELFQAQSHVPSRVHICDC